MSPEPPSRDHWPAHARQWSLVGPPLRPCPEDVALAEAAVAGLRAPRALLLGVTPELATMRWPDRTALVAVDRSASVIGAIFPAAHRALPPGAIAVRAQWLALPCAGGAIDVALGDGSLSNLAYPGEYRALAAELRRALAAGGRLVLRLFAAPPRPESLDEVGAALAAGEVRSFHALKWRIAMAIQPAHRNVRVVEIGRAFDALVGDRAALAARTGWAPEVIATIDVYRGSDLVYSFPTAAEVEDALGASFAVHRVATPGYELGERCPTVVFTPR